MRKMSTRDMSEVGEKEILIAEQLLKALRTKNNKTKHLSKSAEVQFNLITGKVFLVDENYNVGVMEEDKLVDFYSCQGEEPHPLEYPVSIWDLAVEERVKDIALELRI